MKKSGKRPFYITIGSAIWNADRDSIPIIADLVCQTKIPYGYDPILEMIEKKKSCGFWSAELGRMKRAVQAEKKRMLARRAHLTRKKWGW